MTTNGAATRTAEAGGAAKGAEAAGPVAAAAGAAGGPAAAGGADGQPAPVRPVPRVRPTTNGSERRKERGVTLRVLTYVAVAHLLAFYLWLLFAVVGKG